MSMEKPILFSRPMVKAILDGRKTQTRRVIKPQPSNHKHNIKAHFLTGEGERDEWTFDIGIGRWTCPYGRIGDRLWVRETWAHLTDLRTKDPGVYALQTRAFFRADYPTGLNHDDNPTEDLKWRPSIFMPRDLSRLTLEITEIRVERLRDMHHKTEEFEAEGIHLSPCELYPQINRADKLERVWIKGWDKLNAKRGYSWESNPWVWVLTFRKL